MNLSKKSKIFLSILAILVVVGVAGYFYLYQSHTSINDMEVVYKGSAKEFQSNMEANADAWSKAGDKVIELTGTITAKDVKGISVDGNFYFQLEEGTSTENLKKDQKIQIKGRIIGYDDLLGELKLDKAIILKN
ncbi:hypothetical protein EZY14_013790 [Kordia sp. TARA_039_SRF]|nr:hypothetical protein EZY14_013790 [Kordia sp. TARA_039_SRF]